MFNSSSKLQGRANDKMWKRWRLFHATDFESLMYPCFTFCYILGIFPYKINASAFEISKLHYVLSTIATCVCFIVLLIILYMIDVYGTYYQIHGVPRVIERNCFYIFSGFTAILTYILSSPRMRLLQTIMKISSKLPPESFQKLSKLIHAKDILGFFFLLITGMFITVTTNVHILFKIFITYINLLTFQMDMLYMNCVCLLKACFKRINDNLEYMREFMMDDEVYYFGRTYKQRSPFLLIELKAMKKQHLMTSDAVQMLNMIFSLQLLATIVITFAEITFQLYFYVLHSQNGISILNLDNDIYDIFLTMYILYYFVKITLIVWACETAKDQALQIGITIHDVLNSINDNKIKGELQLFSLQILHCENVFSAKGLIMDATLLTAMVGNICTYLLILIQFLKMPHFCKKGIVTNVTEITH